MRRIVFGLLSLFLCLCAHGQFTNVTIGTANAGGGDGMYTAFGKINYALTWLNTNLTTVSNLASAGGGATKVDTNNGTHYVTATGTTTARSSQDRFAHRLNILDFGAIANDSTDDTAAFIAAKAALLSRSPIGGTIYFPDGIYKGNFAVDSRVSIQGESRRGTIFKPATNAIAVLTVDHNNISTNKQDGVYSDFTIDCDLGSGSIGILGGTNTYAGNSGNTFQRVRVIEADLYGIWLRDATACSFHDVIIEDGNLYGIYVDNERSTQLCTWINVRTRQNKVGAYFASGNRHTFIGCDFESNKDTGVYLTRTISSGFASSSFLGCWFENNGHTPTQTNEATAQIYLDGTAAYGLTNSANIRFSECIVSSSITNWVVYDVSADRAQHVIFERCSFSSTNYGGFATNKLRFSTGTGAVFVYFNQCGELNKLPSPELYANWPPSTTAGTGGSTLAAGGFIYDYVYQGRRYSNRNPFGIAGTPIGSVTPTYIGEVVKNTSSGALFVATGLTSSDWTIVPLAGDRGDITMSADGTLAYDAGSILTADIGDQQVTKGKIEGIAAARVLGRLPNAGTGSPSEVPTTGSSGSSAVVLNDTPTISTPRFDSASVNDDAYAAGWNGSTNVPTKNAVYDKIESLSVGGGVSGTMVKASGTFVAGTVPAASDTTGTNFTSSPITVSGTNVTVTGGLAVDSVTPTNGVTLAGSGVLNISGTASGVKIDPGANVTTNSGAMRITGALTLDDLLKDSTGSAGTSGQVPTSAGSGADWAWGPRYVFTRSWNQNIAGNVSATTYYLGPFSGLNIVQGRYYVNPGIAGKIIGYSWVIRGGGTVTTKPTPNTFDAWLNNAQVPGGQASFTFPDASTTVNGFQACTATTVASTDLLEIRAIFGGSPSAAGLGFIEFCFYIQVP